MLSKVFFDRKAIISSLNNGNNRTILGYELKRVVITVIKLENSDLGSWELALGVAPQTMFWVLIIPIQRSFKTTNGFMVANLFRFNEKIDFRTCPTPKGSP